MARRNRRYEEWESERYTPWELANCDHDGEFIPLPTREELEFNAQYEATMRHRYID